MPGSSNACRRAPAWGTTTTPFSAESVSGKVTTKTAGWHESVRLALPPVPGPHPDLGRVSGSVCLALVALVAALTIGLLHGRHLIRPHWNVVAGVSVGLLGGALWIGLCRLNL